MNQQTDPSVKNWEDLTVEEQWEQAETVDLDNGLRLQVFKEDYMIYLPGHEFSLTELRKSEDLLRLMQRDRIHYLVKRHIYNQEHVYAVMWYPSEQQSQLFLWADLVFQKPIHQQGIFLSHYSVEDISTAFGQISQNFHASEDPPQINDWHQEDIFQTLKVPK